MNPKELRKLRRSAGLSQSELAVGSGVARWKLSCAESECGGFSLSPSELARVREVMLASAIANAERLTAALAGGS